MLLVRGGGSAIMGALAPLIKDWVIRVPRTQEMPTDGERYLFCAGLLRPKSLKEQTPEEISEGYRINCGQTIEDCERILSANDNARICVIGSESAYRGSYDGNYARAKAKLHEYVECRALGPEQQLICISPGVIEDAGQHERRTDTERCELRRLAHPKKRFLKAVEVAKLIHFALYEDAGYLTGVVIRLNGGEHQRSLNVRA